MDFPLTIYVAWHPDTVVGPALAEGLHAWLSSSHLGDPGEVVNVYVRRRPPRDLLNSYKTRRHLVVVLVDANVVGDPEWRRALYAIAVAHDAATKHPEREGVTLLPVTLDASFGALDLLAGEINYARLGRWDDPGADRSRQFNRIVTQKALECLRKTEGPRRIFVSHARPDGKSGVGIAEQLQLTALRIGQQEVWFDGNDLGWGGEWRRHLERTPTALPGFIAVLSDRYSSREWCLRELAAARKPNSEPLPNGVLWRRHAVVVVDSLEAQWTQVPDELGGLPIVRWNPEDTAGSAENVLDRVAREALTEEYRAQRAKLLLESHPRLVAGRKVAVFSAPPDAFSAGELKPAPQATVVLPVYRVDAKMRERVCRAIGVAREDVLSYYEIMREERDRPPAFAGFQGTLVFSMGVPRELGDFLPGHLSAAVYRWARAALDLGWRIATRHDPTKGSRVLERSLIEAARAAAYERGERHTTDPDQAVRREEDEAPLLAVRRGKMSERYSSLLGVCHFVAEIDPIVGPEKRVLLVVGGSGTRIVEDLHAWAAMPDAPVLVLPAFGGTARALAEWARAGGEGPFADLDAWRTEAARQIDMVDTESTGEVRKYLRKFLGEEP